MIARDWQIAIALTPIVIIELNTLRDFFWLTGQIDGVTFNAQLPGDGTSALLQVGESWVMVRGSTGGAPLMSLNLLIDAVRARR